MATYDYTILEGLLTESELLEMRTNLVSALTSGTPGTNITSVSTRDLSTIFSVGTPPEQMLKAVNYALYKIDPITYSVPSSSKVRRYSVY